MKSKLSNFFALAISAVSFGVISTPPSLAEGLSAGSTFVDCDYCPEMVVVPAGEFVQGSDKVESGHVDEKPQRTVSLLAHLRYPNSKQPSRNGMPALQTENARRRMMLVSVVANSRR